MMKLFLKKTGLFLSITLVTVLVVIFASKAIALRLFNFHQPMIETVILGDSQTQCGLDDKILPHTLNLSESADTYFYSYVKLKRMLEHNSQIKKVVLGFADHNLTENQDRWLHDNEINSFKLPIYFFMFDKNDLFDFAKINKAQIIVHSHTILKRNFSHLLRIYRHEKIEKFGIGGFLALSKEAKKEEQKIQNRNVQKTLQPSSLDSKYLLKIYALCQSKKISLELISLPQFENTLQKKAHNIDELRPYKKRADLYWHENLPNANYVDFSNYQLQTKDFADGSHLNKNGAVLFSRMLIDSHVLN
ncbi:hypothetical protein [Chryseobacterium sp. R2A-55]|uniref:hypothetical protein n=1 Tax=Chryseobacterium sp. R2A-55 TaxID=2744445 RepID=UPI001F2C38B2|nr:hypothetical protein [Chryseobacterium sp. R2A-55]